MGVSRAGSKEDGIDGRNGHASSAHCRRVSLLDNESGSNVDLIEDHGDAARSRDSLEKCPLRK